MKPPFTYFGGKCRIAPQIVALLPAHEHYVEPFAGSLAVLLAKPPAHMETVNDLHGEIMAFWRILRDRPADLERACALTPHSRAEHLAAYEPAEDELEQARRFWVKLTQGRSGRTSGPTGWRHYRDPDGSTFSMAQYLATYTARIAPAAARLRNVSLESRPAIDVIERYGAYPAALLYCDPPYLRTTRSWDNGPAYQCDMRNEAEHRDLADALRSVQGAVVLSGYHSPLYDELYQGWHTTEIRAVTGNAAGEGIERSRTEVLWSNRPFRHAQDDLFSHAEEAAS